MYTYVWQGLGGKVISKNLSYFDDVITEVWYMDFNTIRRDCFYEEDLLVDVNYVVNQLKRR